MILSTDTMILWNPHLTRLFTWRWTWLFSQRCWECCIWKAARLTQHIHQTNWKALWCSTTAVQIVKETTNCYVHSHLLWSKIRLHYSTFSPSLLPYVRAAFCGMGLSLCSVLKESGKYSEKQTPIVSARHDTDIGLTCNGQWWSYKSICLILYCYVTVCVAECCLQWESWCWHGAAIIGCIVVILLHLYYWVNWWYWLMIVTSIGQYMCRGYRSNKLKSEILHRVKMACWKQFKRRPQWWQGPHMLEE